MTRSPEKLPPAGASKGTDRTRSPGEVPRSKGGLWFAALMTLVVVLAGWLYFVLG